MLRNANTDAGIKRGWSALKMKGLTKSQGANGPVRTGIFIGLKDTMAVGESKHIRKETGELFIAFSWLIA